MRHVSAFDVGMEYELERFETRDTQSHIARDTWLWSIASKRGHEPWKLPGRGRVLKESQRTSDLGTEVQFGLWRWSSRKVLEPPKAQPQVCELLPPTYYIYLTLPAVPAINCSHELLPQAPLAR
jgi:hypothetical protein